MSISLGLSIIAIIVSGYSAYISFKSYTINRKSFENSIKPFIIFEIVPHYQSHINIFVVKVKNDGFNRFDIPVFKNDKKLKCFLDQNNQNIDGVESDINKQNEIFYTNIDSYHEMEC